MTTNTWQAEPAAVGVTVPYSMSSNAKQYSRMLYKLPGQDKNAMQPYMLHSNISLRHSNTGECRSNMQLFAFATACKCALLQLHATVGLCNYMHQQSSACVAMADM